MDEAKRQALQDGVNPAYVPRNHVMQEAVKLADQGDYSEVRLPPQISAASAFMLDDSVSAHERSLLSAEERC